MSDFMLYRGDCLAIMPTLAAGSVDMVMCDLPYGTTACKWDSVIPFGPLWEQYRRIAKKNAAIVLTASQPFTAALGASNLSWLKYSWVWEKSRPTDFLQAKHKPLKGFEDVLVFYANRPVYNPQGTTTVDRSVKNTGTKTRGRAGKKENTDQTFHGAVSGADENDCYRQTVTGYPRGIIKFAQDSNALHPTQKPVALMEYLIRTYTNEGETVLDNCMGSGTTGVACMQSGRNFIGIELNDYAQAAALRILKAWGGDTMRTIFATPFDDETKQATSPSADSGFTTIGEVVEAMGPDWLSCSGRAVVYPGVMFSDYEVSI